MASDEERTIVEAFARRDTLGAVTLGGARFPAKFLGQCRAEHFGRLLIFLAVGQLGRVADQRAERATAQVESAPPETVEDWMAGFQTKQGEPVPTPSPSVDASAFEQAFRNRSNPSPAPTPAPPTALTDAASIVLDARTSQAASARLDELAAHLAPPSEASKDIDSILDDLDLG